ncbi:MAG: hypothetical protein OXL36_19675 [Bryobacterales bacterium]|nr:hypothetical protein [Bryobacterales bacterium]MDE0294642.1 hypothetical protein [Bryobacterales bacterium]
MKRSAMSGGTGFSSWGPREAGRPGLPARPYLGLSVDDEADVDKIIDAWASQAPGS